MVKMVKWIKISLQNRIAVVVTEDEISEEPLLMAISRVGGYKGKVIERTLLTSVKDLLIFAI